MGAFPDGGFSWGGSGLVGGEVQNCEASGRGVEFSLGGRSGPKEASQANHPNTSHSFCPFEARRGSRILVRGPAMF